MTFTAPLALVSLLLIPAITWVGWPGRGHGRSREIASLILRNLIILCLVCSLAGLTWVQPGDNLAVVFLLDRSDSMSESEQLLAVDYLRQSIESMQPNDQAALIVFGADALVERSMSSIPQLNPILSIPATYQTDLEEAIHLAMAIFPADAALRLVILSDGIETTGDVARAARLAAAAGIEIVANNPFQVSPGTEALLSQAEVPSVLSEGERFFMDITIQSSTPMPAVIQVSSHGVLLSQGQVELRRGEQIFSLPLLAGSPGFTDFQVLLIPDQDTYYQNNALSTFSEVTGSPHVLVVAPPIGESMGYAAETRPDESSYLILALQSANYSVETVNPTRLSIELSDLARYASVVLVDVPARQLTLRQMETLESYVRDLGGGLVTVGGPTSYGVGGYFHTPLAEMLPVDIQIHDQQRRPSLAIVFIIDHSGSMSETYGGVTKLELAQEAAMRSVELLFPTDRVGVIAFDETASWVVPLIDLAEPQQITDAIGTLRIGGGTDILAGLQAMAAALPDDPALVKHAILLTDGGADPTGIPELVSRMYQDYGITLSTIGVGRDAAPYLADLAVLGGGRYIYTADPSTVPVILTEETVLATRAYIVEETTYPQLQTWSPILEGIAAVPPLAGYIGTSSRNTARTILVSPQGDPILASWQYGLGRVVSFTSDATSRWAPAWVTWDGFSGFWTQAVEYTISQQLVSPLQIQVNQTGEYSTLTVEAMETSRSTNGILRRFLNDYYLQANLVSPSGEGSLLNLEQIAPGQYQAIFQPAEKGVYLIQVTGQPPDPQSPTLSTRTGWVLDYSPEYNTLNVDAEVLVRLAATSGGRIAPDDPADIFEHNLPSPHIQEPIWPWLLISAAFLLPVDIAVRRIVLGRTDLLRIWAKLRQLFAPQISFTPQPDETRRPTMQGLLNTKARVSERQTPKPDNKDFPPAIERPALADAPSSASSPSSLLEEPEPSSQPTAQQPPDQQVASTASRLLARKRAQRSSKDSAHPVD
jgi:Mg-chelatase subunit ChlD